MNFSQRADSPGFNLFGSSLFGAQNSSDEVKKWLIVNITFPQSKICEQNSIDTEPDFSDWLSLQQTFF